MDRINKYFLEAVGAFLKNQTVDWTEEMDCGTWNDLFRRAQEQSVLPLVFEAVYRNPKFAEIESEFAFVKREVQLQVIMQESRTTEFLKIYRFLNESHIFPIVVKGIICRQLYRLPDFRISSDEDLFVPRGQMGKCHKLLTQYGLETDCNLRSGEDLPEEITYVDGKKGIRLEVHSALFGAEGWSLQWIERSVCRKL
ncbi:MAG: nucleotidyltransferase family protein [Eubacterium sp.]